MKDKMLFSFAFLLVLAMFVSCSKDLADGDDALGGVTLRIKGKRIRDAAFFLIIMLVTFAATLLNPQKYVSSRTIQKCVEHVSTST